MQEVCTVLNKHRDRMTDRQTDRQPDKSTLIAVCCVIPPELSEFAKANSIQLLTHSDARGMYHIKQT